MRTIFTSPARPCFLSILLLLAVSLAATCLKAQGYSRKSLTILAVEYTNSKPIDSYIYNGLEIPDRYDANNIGTKILSIPVSFSDADGYDVDEKIKEAIYAARIPNKILKSILVDEVKGYMTVDMVKERGLYNASDADVMIAKNSARGIDILKDAGLNLLRNIYFLVIKPTSYTTSKEENSTANIYKLGGTGILFQLDLDSAYMIKQFWDEFYFDMPNDRMLQKLLNHHFPLKKTTEYFNVTVTDLDALNKVNVGLQGLSNLLTGKKTIDETNLTRKSESQINKELIKAAVKRSLSSIEANEDFNVRSSIYKVHPLLSKIGKKEGLHADDLFEVKENIQDPKTGTISLRSVGYVRAKRVADNRYNSQGTTRPSAFYKAPSGKIRKGMLLSEVKESPFSLGFSYGLDNTNVMSGAVMNIEYITHWIPGLSASLDAGYVPNLRTASITSGYTTKKGYFEGEGLTGVLAIRQSLNFNRLSIVPLGGLYVSYAMVKSSDIMSSSTISSSYKDLAAIDMGLMFGGDIGINIGRTLQLHGGYRYALSGGSTTKYGDKLFDYTLNYGTSTIIVGIRLFKL